MSSDHHTPAGPVEDDFLARLADVSPVAESMERLHVTAALAALREAGTPVTTGRRIPLRQPARLRRTPRMALSNLAAIIAGLSLPVKAAAASTVAVAALGGGVAVTSTPPETPPAAEAGLDEAEENTGFPVPADGQPEGLAVGEDEEAGIQEDAVEGEEAEEAEHGVDGQAQAEKARTTQDKGEEFGQGTAAEASGGKSTEGRKRAAEARANAEQAEARRQDGEARQAEARERKEAQDRAAEAEARSQQGRDNATSSDDTEDEVETEDAADQSSTGTDRSGAGRAKAQEASGR